MYLKDCRFILIEIFYYIGFSYSDNAGLEKIKKKQFWNVSAW